MSCYHMIVVYKNYTTHQFPYLYIIFSRQFQKCKKDENPTITSRDTCKTVLLFYLNCFLLATHLNLMRLEKYD